MFVFVASFIMFSCNPRQWKIKIYFEFKYKMLLVLQFAQISPLNLNFLLGKDCSFAIKL